MDVNILVSKWRKFILHKCKGPLKHIHMHTVLIDLTESDFNLQFFHFLSRGEFQLRNIKLIKLVFC